jgi:hypothetical protein
MNKQQTWVMRLIASMAIGAIALGAIACNDDKESLTLEEYFQRVDEIDNDGTERIDAVFNGITDEDDVQQFREAFKDFAPILGDLADDLDGLDPPDEVRDEHDAMAEALNAFADKANDIAEDIDDIEAATPDELFAAIDEQGFTETDDAFTAACRDLQQVATDNSIDVDLDCEDEEDEDDAPTGAGSPEIEEAMRAAMAAWNGKDADAFLTFFTDKAIAEIFGQEEPATREEVAALLPEIIGDPPLELHELSTEADGATGAAEVLWDSEPFLEHIRFAFVQEGGAWKIDSQDYIDIDELPAGTTRVHVDANEFAFGVITEDIIAANDSGLISFEITNVGEQTHHFGLFRLPAEGDVQELLMAEEEVPGLDVAGFTDEIAPGETNRAWVFIEPLEPGRYAMVCFLPDTSAGPDGPPHAFQGMVEEFTIPEPSARLAPANMLARL